MQRGESPAPRWDGLDAKTSSSSRILVDVPALYYGHPNGLERNWLRRPRQPARLRPPGRRTAAIPWEAIEATPGARGPGRAREPTCRLTPLPRRARRTAAPRTFSAAAAGSRCANTARATRWTSRSSAPAPAAARSRRCSPNRAFRSSRSMPVPISGRWRISPPTRPSRTSSTGTTRVSTTAPTRSTWAARTAARR